jgi:hypothetical protein
MKTCVALALLAVMVFSASPAMASYSLDGNLNDWIAANKRVFSPIVIEGSGTFQLHSWGADVEGGTLYAFAEVESPLGIPNGDPSGHAYPGLYIDVDNNVATSLGNLPGNVPVGVDINVEIDYDTADIPYGGGVNGHAVNYWGTGNDWVNGCAASTGTDAHNAAQTIFEWSVPVSEMLTQAAACDTGAVPNLDISGWKMYIGGETDLGWGREVGLVPEPGALTMLIGVGLTLLGYVLCRRF